MIETSKRGWLMPCRMVWWWRANFSFQSYTILTRSYIIPGSLTLSLEEKEKKDTCEACVRSTSFPGFSLFLPRGRKREREPWELGWCKVTFRGQICQWKNSVSLQMTFGIKAVLYFSADLYLTAQFIRGNYDWNSRDRRGLACVAWRIWLGALSNMGERGQRNREQVGFLFFTRLRRSFARFCGLAAQ